MSIHSHTFVCYKHATPKNQAYIMKTKSAIILLSFLAYFTLNAQVLELPTRSASALNGDQFVSLVTSMSLTNRENEIYNQLMLGNVPEFMRL